MAVSGVTYSCYLNKGIPLKLDVTIPLGNLTHFLDSIATICGNINPLSIPYVFGHSADGNMHLNILQSEPNVAEMEEEILKFVVSLDGSISAEHGIGALKHHIYTSNEMKRRLGF
ncbi:MAG: hypothetical protein CM15mP49_10270 [Actinomycetota bacterium]|nr:MAG: hypothetical protein CM15mP49_10270 [Actinomycetota bacterium]